MTVADGLLLDDNLEFREVIAEFLRLHGLRTLQAASLAEGRRLLTETTHLRFAVCDLRLPDGSAVEFVHEVCKSYPSARVIVLSGYCDTAEVDRIQQAGAKFMMKPIDFDRLKDALTTG